MKTLLILFLNQIMIYIICGGVFILEPIYSSPISIPESNEYLLKEKITLTRPIQDKNSLKILGVVDSVDNYLYQPLVIDIGTTIGQPADIESEFSRLTQQINLYNNYNEIDIPFADLSTGTSEILNEELNSITLTLNDFDGYIMLKWGSIDQFYYINDSWKYSSDVIPPPFPPNVSIIGDSYTFYSINGRSLSHYTTFLSIPEPSIVYSSLFLLLFLIYKKYNE